MRLRLRGPADAVVGERQSNDPDDDADDEPHPLACHEATRKNARPLQAPAGTGQYRDHAENQTAHTHATTVRARVARLSLLIRLRRVRKHAGAPSRGWTAHPVEFRVTMLRRGQP